MLGLGFGLGLEQFRIMVRVRVRVRVRDRVESGLGVHAGCGQVLKQVRACFGLVDWCPLAALVDGGGATGSEINEAPVLEGGYRMADMIGASNEALLLGRGYRIAAMYIRLLTLMTPGTST